MALKEEVLKWEKKKSVEEFVFLRVGEHGWFLWAARIRLTGRGVASGHCIIRRWERALGCNSSWLFSCFVNAGTGSGSLIWTWKCQPVDEGPEREGAREAGLVDENGISPVPNNAVQNSCLHHLPED